MPTGPSNQFDFEKWSELAQSNPAAFEQRRLEAIESFLQEIPPERRLPLRRLQWRIDRTRERAPNPMSACIQLSQMMWDSLLGEGGLRDRLEQIDTPSTPRRPKAQVLPFRRWN